MEREDKRKDCCKDEKNLGPVVHERSDLTYRRCEVCGCRHFELMIEPGRFGLQGAPL